MFPPKTDEAEQALFLETVPGLRLLDPAFISVTYGAGGGTRTRTLRMASRLRREFSMEVLGHLTCVGSTREDLIGILDEAKALDITNILALRGDPPKGQAAFQAVEGGFRFGIDLVHFVRQRGGFAVGVAGYPEGHVECPDKRVDWDRTAAKVHAGADFLITQLFYDPEDFLAFEDYLRNRHGVRIPIVPGVLPFLSTEQVRKFTSFCGARLSDDLQRKLERYADDHESARKLGVEVCTDICRRLLDHGVPGIHVYCLNRVTSCSELLHNLGLAGKPPATAIH
jgi:methylenetetrahydrofolate reductase (NADPH)